MPKTERLPRADNTLCMSCRVCVVACPFGCLEMAHIPSLPGELYPTLAHPETCTGCAICATACPIGVIDMVKP